ncbi:MAG: biotin--[acetyl-CoA-carboxylase] ligase [Candidatus Pseudobacter hemicellulosilyticus]|uniref:Biotin--[acetyl-CoA-carboxylase] ligase n=1 Tax=Candidatus Pseudobacter hemicellulosilyticus TaxID=3121375 RepID=A0AAJ5WVD6_9BACT|nr:MAG: biotin--[acetyl-CoA-carboxylase] ligase [Pseudobacter sp.]
MPHPAIFQPLGKPLTVLSSVDSTNNYAMAQVRSGLAGHGAAWLAMEQTAGRGQRGKTWVTNPGDNLLLSIALQTSALPAGSQFLLSAAIALGCYDFFKIHAGDETRVKWPNDLYWRDRKAAGILIENRHLAKGEDSGPEGAWSWAIAGMGININQTSFAEGVRNPVSLKQITGKDFDVLVLTKDLCTRLSHRWEQLVNGDAQSLLTDYRQALYKLGETVRLKKDSRIFETTITGVSSDGRLLTRDTLERQFSVGEIEWVF